jgi:hypothetical protein
LKKHELDAWYSFGPLKNYPASLNFRHMRFSHFYDRIYHCKNCLSGVLLLKRGGSKKDHQNGLCNGAFIRPILLSGFKKGLTKTSDCTKLYTITPFTPLNMNLRKLSGEAGKKGWTMSLVLEISDQEAQAMCLPLMEQRQQIMLELALA